MKNLFNLVWKAAKILLCHHRKSPTNPIMWTKQSQLWKRERDWVNFRVVCDNFAWTEKKERVKSAHETFLFVLGTPQTTVREIFIFLYRTWWIQAKSNECVHNFITEPPQKKFLEIHFCIKKNKGNEYGNISWTCQYFRQSPESIEKFQPKKNLGKVCNSIVSIARKMEK